MPAENTFSYKRTLKPIPIMEVHFSLLKAKPLCLAGVRSRYGDNNSNNAATANNTFTIRVTKAGILDRKYDFIQGGKKATARGWRPFGIILSGSQIIFFADIQSFQNWLDEEEQQTKGNVAPRRNHSFPAFSSITESTSTSDLSVNHVTVNSISSLYPPSSQSNSTTTSHIPNTTSASSTTPASSYLRPVQIVSLSYAICICDESYTKYPHVFRLITGDGQQFLLRADNDEDMEDWMLKINYAATLKTTGIRMRPTKRPLMSFDSFHTTASTFTTNTTTTKEQRYTIDRLKREDKAKEKVQELSDRIDEQVKLLDRELQLRRNLMVLVPLQKSTKDRVLSFAEVLGKRIKTKRIELQRLECYRDYLECELAWCLSQHQQIHQSNSSNSISSTSRKLSLPLPTHLYSFSSASSSTSTHADPQQQQQKQLQLQQKQNVKKLANLVFTDPSDDSSPISTSTSTSSLRNSHPTLENSSVHSSNSSSSSNQGNEDDDDEEDDDEGGDHSSLHSEDKSSSNTTAATTTTEAGAGAPSAPQLPAFAFPKSFIENISFMDKVNVKSASDKAVEMDRVMRRRSQSNPILPNKLVDKKLLLPKGNRARSGSEASSVKEDDDDMSVIMVNDSEEMLVESSSSSSWPTTSVTTEEPQDIIPLTVT